VSRETKVGLLIGVIFIGLFGLILSLRAGSETVGHANLPVGESQKYRTMARAVRHDVDPFIEHSVLDIAPAGPRGEGPEVREAREERLPAPGSIRETEPPARTVSDVGVIAAGPIEVVTPVGERRGEGPAAGESPTVREAERAKESAPAAPTYVVRANDSLVRIAHRFYGAQGDRLWRRIYEANRSVLSDPDRLRPGQELVIPGVEASPAPAPASVPAVTAVTAAELAEMLGNRSDLSEAPSPLPATYTVQRGDTFYGIAERLYGNARYASLLHLKNKHLVPDATKLRAGQRILLLEGVEAAGEQVAMR
jgi:nucleoid-associated protein YgaU